MTDYRKQCHRHITIPGYNRPCVLRAGHSGPCAAGPFVAVPNGALAEMLREQAARMRAEGKDAWADSAEKAADALGGGR